MIHDILHAEYPADESVSANFSRYPPERAPSIVYARAASQQGSYLASIVIDLHTTLGEVQFQC
jgi:hypothetical protein